uniref:Uncharacterized protein n=1 Tax=Arundo donax TaxID=35708 RepID=A0A0A9FGP6_ARUDO
MQFMLHHKMNDITALYKITTEKHVQEDKLDYAERNQKHIFPRKKTNS